MATYDLLTAQYQPFPQSPCFHPLSGMQSHENSLHCKILFSLGCNSQSSLGLLPESLIVFVNNSFAPLLLNNRAPKFLAIVFFSTLPLYLTHPQGLIKTCVKVPKSTPVLSQIPNSNGLLASLDAREASSNSTVKATFISSFTFPHEILPVLHLGWRHSCCRYTSLTLTSSTQ